MKRRNTQSIKEILRDFFEDNEELYEKVLAIRIQRAWRETLGPTINHYTRNLFIRDDVLYVQLTSSVLRSELIISKEKLIKSLNEYAGRTVIRNIVFR